MAIAAWDSRNPQLQMHAGGSIPQIVYGNNEANSQSFKAGNLITLHASTGLVTAIADSSGSASPIAGIAMEDATTVSSGNIEIPFMAITSETEVLIRVADNSEALEASDTTCVTGHGYDLQELSTNLQAINSGDDTNPAFIYIGPVLDSAGASTYWGRFRVKYVEAQIVAS